jgi:hypothetical protein
MSGLSNANCINSLSQTGRHQPARAALSAGIELYRAMDMTFWLPQAEAVLAQVEGREWTMMPS